uniref:8-oxo-dGTP diphosphatase n=1 Tax=OCS116 cluster bacterium TaxID=2030921 RepID=A0A2A4Z3P7_9PROT
MTKIKLVVACALIDIDGRVLLQQRPEGKEHAGLWEFPGGKVEAGETTDQALIRELKEELNIDTAANCLAPLSFSTHDYDGGHLLMPLFICRRWKGIMQPMEGQRTKWVKAKNLKDYKMPPADIPFIPPLIEILP